MRRGLAPGPREYFCQDEMRCLFKGLVVRVGRARGFRRLSGEDFDKAAPGFVFGVQHHLGCSAGVFSGVVVVKLQGERLFQMAKAVATIALELGPGAARDGDTVDPMQRGHI